jgi:WD40 repeat protein
MRLYLRPFVVALAVIAVWPFVFPLRSDAADRYPVQIVPQTGHSSAIDTMAISHSGRLLASSASFDGTIRLWDVHNGRLLRRFETGGLGANALAFSPDGTQLAAALALAADESSDALRVWDVAAGTLQRTVPAEPNSAWFDSLAFNADGTQLMAGGGDGVLVLDIVSGKTRRPLVLEQSTSCSTIVAPAGWRALRVCSGRGRMWDEANGASGAEIELFEPSDSFVKVSFSSDGRTLLVHGPGWPNSKEKGIRLLDAASGAAVRSIDTTETVSHSALSRDGHTLVLRRLGNDELWDVRSGTQLATLATSNGDRPVRFSPDGATVFFGGHDGSISQLSLATRSETRSFRGRPGTIEAIAISPDAAWIATGGNDGSIKLWQKDAALLVHVLPGNGAGITALAFSADGRRLVAGGENKSLRLWDRQTGKLTRDLVAAPLSKDETFRAEVRSVALSRDGRLAAAGTSWRKDSRVRIWDVAAGKVVREIVGGRNCCASLAFSPDSRSIVLSGGYGSRFTIADVATGKERVKIKMELGLKVHAVAFSPDGRTVLTGGDNGVVLLWDAATGRQIREYVGASGNVSAVAYSNDGQRVYAAGYDGKIRTWQTGDGRHQQTFTGLTGGVVSLAASDRDVIGASREGTATVWAAETGERLVTLMSGRGSDRSGIAMSRDGFISGQLSANESLTIVRGLVPTGLDQVHQSLFNPDLVRETVRGDPDGEVKRAAQVMNLDAVLDSGPPPRVVITSHDAGSRSRSELVTVAARIADAGKGVGRIEWRVNGVTTGVRSAPSGPAPVLDITQQLALDAGANRIEVIAYEGRNLLASPPAQVSIFYEAQPNAVKPKLHVLAIGIDKYVDHGFLEPGSGKIRLFPPLNASVRDAIAFSAIMEKAGAGQYAEVRVTKALDAEATLGGLERTISKLAGEIGPGDTFVFYAASHGYSIAGNYYLIPQDFQGGPSQQALEMRAIGQDRLQDWIANRIKAKKAILLLDTCESGALTSGHTMSRTEGAASEATVGRLHEATGRPVLSAASASQSAYEGYKGHGVFTYALMEAFHKGDTNANGTIEVTELAAYVERRVPEIFAELKAKGWVVKGVAMAAPRGVGEDAQSARFGSKGEEFIIAKRLP